MTPDKRIARGHAVLADAEAGLIAAFESDDVIGKGAGRCARRGIVQVPDVVCHMLLAAIVAVRPSV